jgi:hypothetical protein
MQNRTPRRQGSNSEPHIIREECEDDRCGETALCIRDLRLDMAIDWIVTDWRISPQLWSSLLFIR